MAAEGCPILSTEDWEESSLSTTRLSKLSVFHNKEDDESFVLKKANTSRSTKLLWNEFRILQYLANQGIPTIVRPLGMVIHSGELALQLPYIYAGTLRKYCLSTEFLLENDIKELFLKIVDTVAFLHRLDIVHRDLKPENILYCPNTKKITLIDFGLAQECERVMFNRVCGSKHYLAPELIARKPFICLKKVDIWALGILLYFLTYKRKPFVSRKKDKAEVFEKIQFGKLVFGKGVRVKQLGPVSSTLKSLLKLILQKNPEERISLVNIINHSWFKKN